MMHGQKNIKLNFPCVKSNNVLLKAIVVL